MYTCCVMGQLMHVYRMHYRLYYALYLYENDSSLTASDLGSAFQSSCGQQSIRKYRYCLLTGLSEFHYSWAGIHQ